jgi:hypothetical protein
MPGTLQEAIALVKQGQKREARQVLEALMRANPSDVNAWFWYAETIDSLEQRIRVLEMCLKANPGHPQAEKALAVLRAQLAPPEPEAPKPDLQAASNEPVFRLQPEAEVDAPITWEDEPEQPATIDWEQVERQQMLLESPGLTPPVKPESKSYPFYDVWLTALTSRDEYEYLALLMDKDAGQSRAYEWMAYTGLITGLVLPFGLSSEFQEALPALSASLSPVLFTLVAMAGSAVLGAIGSVLGLVIGAAVQFMLARVLGGSGNYTRTVYALAAYMAPLNLVAGILFVVPFLQCLAPILGVYGMILNVRALKAAHYMDAARAWLVILLPGLVILAVLCLLILSFLPLLDYLP